MKKNLTIIFIQNVKKCTNFTGFKNQALNQIYLVFKIHKKK